MIPQDTNINLCIINDNNETLKGLLKMQHNNGNVSLSFYRELQSENQNHKVVKRIAQIPENVYQLSDFTMIEMDSKDRLIVTLSGSRSHCVLYFTRDNDIHHFLNYISSKVRLKNSDCNPCVYLLEPLDSTATPVTPFNTTTLPISSQHANKAPSRVSLQKIQHHKLSFSTNEEVKKMSKEEYLSLFDEEGRIKDKDSFPKVFYNKEIDMAVMADLWKLLMNPEDAQKSKAERKEMDEKNMVLYKQVKKQWQSTTPLQWKYHPDLRKLVDLLERDLEARSDLFKHFEHPEYVQRIAFNVLITLSLWNWDNASYVEGMIAFLSPFLDSFIKDADYYTVITPNDEKVAIENIESEIFWCFEQFYDRNQLCDLIQPSSQSSLKPLIIAVGYILEDNFPDLLQLLYQKHAISLDFLKDDCSKWFTTCFEAADIKRLWISVLSFSSSFQFFQCFIVSLLFSLAPQFVEMNPLNSDEFIRKFHILKKKVPLTLLLQNSNNLMEILNTKRNQLRL